MKKSALNGYQTAAFTLGVFYGFAKRYEESYRWYSKVIEIAEKNNEMTKGFSLDISMAVEAMGIFHRLGLGGIPQNFNESNRWFQQCADMRNARCQMDIAIFQKILTKSGGLSPNWWEEMKNFNRDVIGELLFATPGYPMKLAYFPLNSVILLEKTKNKTVGDRITRQREMLKKALQKQKEN